MPGFASLHDSRRLVELRELAILDTPPEPEYDDLAALAAAVCGSTVAAVNFVDEGRHFTKAVVGLPGACGDSVANDLSLCAATLQTADGVLVVDDTHADPRWRDHPLIASGPRIGFYAGVSILSRGQRVGVVCASGSEPRKITEQQRAALAALARQAERRLDLRRRNAALHELALTDGLTGLANRAMLFDRLEQAVANRERSGGDIGVLFCDVDDFKGINDRLGHAVGDRLLCDLAERLRGESRDTDTVARIGGDEFVVVCPRLGSEAQLDALAQRVAGAAHERHRIADDERAPRLSVGAVVARDGERPADILRRADATMYLAKATSPTHRPQPVSIA